MISGYLICYMNLEFWQGGVIQNKNISNDPSRYWRIYGVKIATDYWTLKKLINHTKFYIGLADIQKNVTFSTICWNPFSCMVKVHMQEISAESL